MTFKDNNKVKMLGVVMLTVFGVYIGLEYMLPLFAPFIIAYLIAAALSPVVKFLNRTTRLPKLLGAIISLSLLIAVIGFILYNLGDMLLNQVVALLKNFPIYLSVLTGYIDKLCEGCDKCLGIKLGTVQNFIYTNFDGVLVIIKNKIMPVITTRSINLLIGMLGFIGILLIMLVSILLLIKDDEQYREGVRNSVFYKDIHLVTSKLSGMGIAYLKTQGIMLLLISLICTVSMFLIHNKYALLVGIGIGVVDAFPILGSGMILIPWAVINLFQKDIYSAAILFTAYVGCQLLRQTVEPKLFGNRIGIKPVYTMMAMYVGVKLFGFFGFLLGPVGLVLIVTIIKEARSRLGDA
ncbi:AI-2E family transporter [Anaerocolumna xylanovorans]|uniref:Sporulation integral membrane protein YtvI n=1 Tax=Anaerocolumna xylanovorans DSM 12503 TaxID=1121345 RepID=A0A1M7YK75_9FIRM|nr:AI-2E family transporter [Anaerocolumna xylanovorans]SHO53007.1 sporulation integral membrane protein YtvI [Anaerocolumna xylanovorans DSM 12503]